MIDQSFLRTSPRKSPSHPQCPHNDPLLCPYFASTLHRHGAWKTASSPQGLPPGGANKRLSAHDLITLIADGMVNESHSVDSSYVWAMQKQCGFVVYVGHAEAVVLGGHNLRG